MSNQQDSAGPEPREPTARELRAARRRAHEEEKKRKAAGGGGGKGNKMGKGGSQGPSSDDRSRR